MKTTPFLGLCLYLILLLFLGCAVQKEKEGNEPGTILWTFDADAESGCITAPAIGPDGTIYFGYGVENILYAVDPEGNEKWRFQTVPFLMSPPVIGPDEEIYLACDTILYAISPEGNEKWTFSDNSMPLSFPTVGSSGEIYIGGKDSLYVLGPHDGSHRGFFALPEVMNYRSVAIGKGGVIYTPVGCTLYALFPDGTAKWEGYYSENCFRDHSLSIGPDGTLYLLESNGVLAAVEGKDGSLKWRSAGPYYHPPVIGSDGMAYIVEEGKACALNPVNGAVLWCNALDLGASAPVIGEDEMIYIGSRNGEFYAMDSRNTAIIEWSIQLGGAVCTSAALSPDGVLYVGADDGKLYAIQSSSQGLAKGCWPRYRHDNLNSNSTEAPRAPTNFQAHQIPDRQIHLSWQDNSRDEKGFLLLVKEPPFPSPVKEVVVQPEFTSWQWNWKPENLGKPHSFRVAAFNDNGQSAFTPELTLVPQHLIPYVVIRYPNEREKWLAGEQKVIKWNWLGLLRPLRVSVHLSADGGSNWKLLHDGETVPNTGYLEIVVPDISSGHCLVKVQGGEYYDLSNEAFSIRPALP